MKHASVTLLTVVDENSPSHVAQCRDGHGFWEGTRTQDPEVAEAEARVHDNRFHPVGDPNA